MNRLVIKQYFATKKNPDISAFNNLRILNSYIFIESSSFIGTDFFPQLYN